MEPSPDNVEEPRGPGRRALLSSPISIVGAFVVALYLLAAFGLSGGEGGMGAIGAGLRPIFTGLAALAGLGWFLAVYADKVVGGALLAIPLLLLVWAVLSGLVF